MGNVSPDDRREESPKFACAVGVRLPDEQREEPRRGRKGSSDALAGVGRGNGEWGKRLIKSLVVRIL